MAKTKRSIQWIQTNQNQKYAGIHIVADFWLGNIIEDPKRIEEILVEAAKRGNNVPLETAIHKFEPQGITGVVLLAESHIALHLWPEYKYLAIDIFTCGDKATPDKSLAYLKEVFQPEKAEVKKIIRGNYYGKISQPTL